MKSVKKQLKDAIEKKIADTVIRPEVPAKLDAIEPITEAVLEEVAPQIEHLTNSEPWWQSRVTLGAIIIIVTRLLAHFGYKIPEELHGAILDLLIAFGPYFGAGLALWGRYGARRPLLSWLKRRSAR